MKMICYPRIALEVLPVLIVSVSCTKEISSSVEQGVPLSDVAEMFASLPIEKEHLEEVHHAVSSSISNGYDEEYTMGDIFASPGSGVGAVEDTKSDETEWSNPLRTLITRYLSRERTKSDYSGITIDKLISSDTQIYWPFSELWDGESFPVITFDPGNGASSNVGYASNSDGEVEEIIVTEAMAKERPVWVINRNEDSVYPTIETLRRDNPDWGKGGGISVTPTKSWESGEIKTLKLKSLTAHRNYDNWFAGASEFFIKCGAVEDFSASTEAEMKLYQPSITDFMVVVKRKYKDESIPFDVVLVSEWTEQLTSLAFMITEDDGGTRTSWKCAATVKVKSKSYGFDIELPLNSRDDIVWRGQLSRKYFEKNNNVEGHFGDVDLTFLIE